MTTPDTSSELDNIMEELKGFLYPDDMGTIEHYQWDGARAFLAAERQRWDAAARKAELVILHEFKLQQHIYSGLLEDYIMERMAALTTAAETAQNNTEGKQ